VLYGDGRLSSVGVGASFREARAKQLPSLETEAMHNVGERTSGSPRIDFCSLFNKAGKDIKLPTVVTTAVTVEQFRNWTIEYTAARDGCGERRRKRTGVCLCILVSISKACYDHRLTWTKGVILGVGRLELM
jgi:hypothetical protein